MKIYGVITALITPFKGGNVDTEGLAANVEEQIAAGVHGLMVLGTTGEGATLSDSERELVISSVVKQVKGRVLVLAGSGDNCTASTIRRTEIAKHLGADVSVLIVPYYNRPSQEGIIRHVESVAKAVSIPLILYNNPIRTGVNLLPDAMIHLSKNPSIIGIKETSGSMLQMTQVIHGVDPSFSVMAGDDIFTLPLMALGAKGIIGAASNLIPDAMVALYKAIQNDEWAEARRMHYELLPFFEATGLESNPMPIKEMMALCGKPSGPCRLPLCGVKPETKARLQQVLTSLQLQTAQL